MKHLLMALVTAFVLAGCTATGDGKIEEDSTNVAFGPGPPGRGPGAGRRAGMDSSRGMGRGAMMTGDMATDMTMMNGMMLAHLDTADPLFDLRFLHMMIPHHEGAVAMAEDALSKGAHPEIKKLARAIIASQTGEIGRMSKWLVDWYGDSAVAGGPGIGRGGRGGGMGRGPVPMSGTMIEQMREMNRMMVAHLGVADSTYDRRFIDMMIPHHQGGVEMARRAMQHSSHSELKALARAIVSDQEKEISEMKQWRAKWYPE